MKIVIKDNFTEIRIRKGYSVTELAKLMQVNPSVVFRMEQRKPIRPATAKKASVALNEAFETLFTIEN